MRLTNAADTLCCPALTKIGSVWLLPPTLTLQYHVTQLEEWTGSETLGRFDIDLHRLRLGRQCRQRHGVAPLHAALDLGHHVDPRFHQPDRLVVIDACIGRDVHLPELGEVRALGVGDLVEGRPVARGFLPDVARKRNGWLGAVLDARLAARFYGAQPDHIAAVTGSEARDLDGDGKPDDEEEAPPAENCEMTFLECFDMNSASVREQLGSAEAYDNCRAEVAVAPVCVEDYPGRKMCGGVLVDCGR